MAMPQKLDELLEMFDMFPDPSDRTGLLLSYSEQFREVPPEIARRPFDKSHQVPQCESDAYVWAMKQPDGTLDLHFAVENPQEVVKQGEEVDVKILRVDSADRKICLSLKRAQWGDTSGAESQGGGKPFEFPTRGGMDEHGSMGTDKIKF